MNIPRKHHFIPAFYLREWCDPETGKLIEYSIKNGKLISKPVGADATGFEYDLYAFDELPPDQAQFIEQYFFNYADRTASDALQLHLTGDTKGWNQELLSAWSRFVIALHVRHPDAMPEIRSSANAIWDGSGPAAQQRYELIREPGDPATFDEYVAKIDPLVSAKARVNLIIKAFDNEIVGTHVNNMKRTILDVSRAPHTLLLSDRPVGMFNLKDPKGMISLPISPTKLFVAANDPQILDHLRGTRPAFIVRTVNTHLVQRAHRFVWSADVRQAAFIQKHMSSKLEPLPFFPTLKQA